MKPILLLDVDGPLARFTEAYLRVLESFTGTRHTVDEVDRWDIHECRFFHDAARRLGCDDNYELRRYVTDEIVKPGFCASIAPHPEAIEAVGRLSQIAEIYVVTSPWDSSPTWMHERLHWVARHFGIPRGHVIQAGRKHLIRGDVFVDDKPSHVEEWARAWPNGAAVLFDMHHNRSDGAGLRRGGWELVISEVGARSSR